MSENHAKGLDIPGDDARYEVKSCFIIWIRVAVLLLSGLSGLSAAEFQPGERLDYTFSYRGLFSGFIEIKIAHASITLAAQPVSIDGHPAYLAECTATTKPFAEAEMIYPIRYRFLSWFGPTNQLPYLAMEYSQTNEDKEELLWFDREHGLGFRYQKNQLAMTPDAKPPFFPLPGLDIDPEEWSLAEGTNRQALPEAGVWDYLSLLYRLRFGALSAGKSFDLQVFNGKQIKTYRIGVTQDRFTRDGWDLPAFKLDLFEVRNGKRKAEKITTIWISDDASRLPLLFQVERVVGVFEGLLEANRPMTAGAMDAPDQTVSPSS